MSHIIFIIIFEVRENVVSRHCTSQTRPPQVTPQTSRLEAITPELGPVGLWSPKSSTFSGSDSIVVEESF